MGFLSSLGSFPVSYSLFPVVTFSNELPASKSSGQSLLSGEPRLARCGKGTRTQAWESDRLEFESQFGHSLAMILSW